MEDDMQLNCY